MSFKVVSAGTGPAASSSVNESYLYLDDPRIGVVYGSTDDQGQKFQDALNMAAAAEGGTVFVGGRFICRQEIIWPSQGGGRGAVRLLGRGSANDYNEAPSAISWDTDVAGPADPGDHAATTFGLRVALDSLPPRIEKILLQGPGTTVAVGDAPCNMYGLFMPTGCVLHDVTISRFGAGVGIINDHQEYHSCDFRGNGYGLDFMDNSLGGLGDLLFDRVYLIGQSRASIAVSDSNAIANARFTQGHCGASPFGIYRYAGQETPRGVAMQGVVFENWSWEYCGNAMFYDEAGGGGWGDVVFDSPAEAGTGGSAKWPGKPWPMAKSHIDYGDGFHWRDGPAAPQADSPDAPLVSAQDFSGFMMDDARPLADAILGYEHKAFVKRPGGFGLKFVGGRLGNRGVGPGGLELGACEAQEDIRKGALVETYGTNQVRESRNSATSEIVGLSLIDYDAGDVCVFASYGTRSLLTAINNSGSTIAQGALLAPDGAHQGGVKTWASMSDGPILGRLHDTSITSGTLGPVTMRI